VRHEIRDQWVEALRSGRYAQGTGQLHKDDRYCCLGVLCELAAEAGVVEKEAIYHDYSYDGVFAFLPDNVVQWAGLSDLDPKVGDTYLSHLNDLGTPFPVIAQVIEDSL
jgi:hypothetical protein